MKVQEACMRIKLLLSFLLFSQLILNSTISAQFDYFKPATKLGGYGELHYNYSIEEGEDASKTLDFHRFVVFFSHAWSEKWSFQSELELEHNFVEEGQGELELEQAYVNYHHEDWLGFRAGVVLVGAGLLNEYHEPPTFLGTERPDYHNVIIPTTWFGNGLALYGTYNDFNYKFTVMEGLDADGFSAESGIRGGRQKGFKADAENLLFNLRVDYMGIPGLKAGLSYTYNEAKGDSIVNPINLIEGHLRLAKHNIIINAEFGNIDYSNGEVRTSRGWYLDIGYNFAVLLDWESQLIPFFRYQDINTAAATVGGGDSEREYHNKLWMAGLTYKPIEQVVFKVDYSRNTNELSEGKTDFFNIGVGYMF
jgi:hypothetical protein